MVQPFKSLLTVQIDHSLAFGRITRLDPMVPEPCRRKQWLWLQAIRGPVANGTGQSNHVSASGERELLKCIDRISKRLTICIGKRSNCLAALSQHFNSRLGTKWLRLERRSCGVELTVAAGIVLARTAVWPVIRPVVGSKWKTSRGRVVALGYVF